MQANITSDGVLVIYTDNNAETFAVKHLQPILIIKDANACLKIKQYDLIEKELT